MNRPYANRVAGFGTTVFAEINMLANEHQAVNLGQGRPDFDGPPEVIEAAMEAMRAGHNQYPPGIGIPQMRQAVVDHAKRFYGMEFDPDKGVIITSGATEGDFAAILGLIDEGDEVILLEPYYDTYLSGVLMSGGIPVYVPMYPPEWTFDEQELRAAFNEKTRAIIINSPHNPTGKVFNRQELTIIADLCQEYDVIVITDEVYEHLTFGDHEHIPIGTLPGMFERTLRVSSAAKTFNVTGWKIGWVCGTPELVTGAWRIHQNVTFAVNHPGQFGVAAGLNLPDSYYEEYLAFYTAKRDLLLEGLNAGGIKATSPDGTFYVMADFSDVFEGDDIEFTRHLIKEVGVACIPPSAFFSKQHKHLTHNHVRFSFCKTDDTLHAAAERLVKLK